MTRYTQTIRIRKSRPWERWLCRRRTGYTPDAMTPMPWAAFVPYRFRRFHWWYSLGGYFWMPCPLCGHEFGGHECGATIPNPARAPLNRMICPACSRRQVLAS